MHLLGLDDQTNGLTMSPADLNCRFLIHGEMNVITPTDQQTLLANRIQKTRRRAMIHVGWGGLRFQTQVYSNSVPLTGPDGERIRAEGKPLFLMGDDNLFQLRPREQNPISLRLS